MGTSDLQPVSRSTCDKRDSSCEIESLTCGIGHYVQVGNVGIELTCRIPTGVSELLGVCVGRGGRGNPTHLESEVL